MQPASIRPYVSIFSLIEPAPEYQRLFRKRLIDIMKSRELLLEDLMQLCKVDLVTLLAFIRGKYYDHTLAEIIRAKLMIPQEIVYQAPTVVAQNVKFLFDQYLFYETKREFASYRSLANRMGATFDPVVKLLERGQENLNLFKTIERYFHATKGQLCDPNFPLTYLPNFIVSGLYDEAHDREMLSIDQSCYIMRLCY